MTDTTRIIDEIRAALDDEAIACFPDFTAAVRALLDHITAQAEEIERLRFSAGVTEKMLNTHFEASQAKSVEIENLRAYIDKAAKEVAATIAGIRERDVSVEQRMRAEAAEARVRELEGALKPFSRFAGAVFSRNFNKHDDIMELDPGDGDLIALSACDFFDARAALAKGVSP